MLPSHDNRDRRCRCRSRAATERSRQAVRDRAGDDPRRSQRRRIRADRARMGSWRHARLRLIDAVRDARRRQSLLDLSDATELLRCVSSGLRTMPRLSNDGEAAAARACRDGRRSMICPTCGRHATPTLNFWWCSPCGSKVDRSARAPAKGFRRSPEAAFDADGRTCRRCKRVKVIHCVAGWYYAWCFACQHEPQPKQGSLFSS
jgi:hypothetical protein